MTAWAHLPNARHIDAILADLNRRPDIWGAAWRAARGTARDAALDAVRDAAWRAARGTAWDAARGAAWRAAPGAAWSAAWSAIAALIAFDDCAHLLDGTPKTVRLHYAVSKGPSATLLLPAAIALASVRSSE